MLMPSAPKERALTKLRPSAIPPEATNGILSFSAAKGNKIKFVNNSKKDAFFLKKRGYTHVF